MVVALRQVAELPTEALAAGIVFAGRAIAVAPPVAEGLGSPFEFGIVGEDRTALAHGDVVGRVKTQGADVAESADQLAVVGRAEGVAAILDQPELVFPAQRGNHIQVVGIAQGMGQHDCTGLRTDRGFDLGGVDVVGAEFDIDENGNCAELQDGVDRGRETGGYGDDFISGLDRALAEAG